MSGFTVWPQSFSFRDDKGLTSWLRFFIQGNDQATALSRAVTILGLITPGLNAAFQRANGAYTSPPVAATYGTAAEYPSCEDKARLIFVTDQGARVVFDVPAPKVTLFLPDGETFNPSNSAANNIVQALRAHGVATRDGDFVTTFVGGYRVRVPLNRKRGLFVLNPQLTTPGI